MKESKTSINQELKEIKHFKSEKNCSLNYQKLIIKQQEVIQSLKQEILLLKSYISLQKVNSFSQITCSDISIHSTCTSWNQTSSKSEQEEYTSQLNKRHEKIVKSVCKMLSIQYSGNMDENKIIENLTKLMQNAAKKHEPIFVERIKEIKVPITVEKVVDKIVQKIVYVDKIIEKPVFKQKIVQKFIQRKPEQNPESSSLKKSQPQKPLRQKQSSYIAYQRGYQQESKYEPYRRYEVGNNMIKRKGDSNRSYYRKDY